MQFESNFVTEILLHFQKKDGAVPPADRIRLSELSNYLGIPQQDVKLICNIIRRMHLLNVKAMADNDNEYWLTAAGKVRLAQLAKAEQYRPPDQK